jgi:hypothetical protein
MDVDVNENVDVNMNMNLNLNLNVKSKWRRLDAYCAWIACRSVCCAVRDRVLTVTHDTWCSTCVLLTKAHFYTTILYSTIPHLTLPYPTLHYLTLPYLTIPYPTIPYHTTMLYYIIIQNTVLLRQN